MDDVLVLALIIAIIFLAFLVLAFLPVAIVLFSISRSKESRERKERLYKGQAIGLVTKLSHININSPYKIHVSYTVDGVRYKIIETAKMKVELIRVGSIPVGMRKTLILDTLEVGDTVRILYDEQNPKKAIIKGNNGVITG